MVTLAEPINTTKEFLPSTGLTGTADYAFVNIFNRQPRLTIVPVNTGYYRPQSDANKIHLAARESIIEQYGELEKYYEHLPLDRVISESLKTLNIIIGLEPDAISYELTSDQSIIFTFKIKKYTFFLQQILVIEEEGDDEAILSTYMGEKKMLSYAGTLEIVLGAVYFYIGEQHTVQPEAELNELSY